MRILVTNDDGYGAPGIERLAEAFFTEHEVWIFAPQKEQSGCSHSLTMHRPLRIEEHGVHRFSADGTPTDCVYLALHKYMSKRPDIILSGINRGANMGDDITYSGTVAAAMEGAINRIPSIAFSLNDYSSNADYGPASTVAEEFVRMLQVQGFDESMLFNINIPKDCDPNDFEFKIGKLGLRQYNQSVELRKDPRGREYCWIGGQPFGSVPVEGSDIEAVEEGYVSVTPLSMDLTDYAKFDFTKSILLGNQRRYQEK